MNAEAVAHGLRLAGNYEQAVHHFDQLSGSAPTPDVAVRMKALSILCSGLLLLECTLDHHQARQQFQAARDLFKQARDRGNEIRSEALRVFAHGACRQFEDEWSEAAEAFENARVRFVESIRLLPAETKELTRFALKAEMERAGSELIDDATDDDFDGALAELNALKQSCIEIRAFLRTPEENVQFDSYALHMEGILERIKGGQFLARFEAKDAIPALDRSAKLSGDAAASVQNWAGASPVMRIMGKLYAAASSTSSAYSAYASFLQKVISGDIARAHLDLTEIARSFNDASRVYAECGLRGMELLYVTASMRDTLTNLSNAILREHGQVLQAAPDFTKLLGDQDLAHLMVQEFQEMIAAYLVRAWRLCVVGAGGIIEAVLLDRVRRHWPQVQAACSDVATSEASAALNWDLGGILSHSERSRLVSPGNLYLSDAIRQWRNLVHPGRQIRDQRAIDEESALGAIKAVRWLIANLK